MDDGRWTMDIQNAKKKIILILEGFKYNTLYKVYIVL